MNRLQLTITAGPMKGEVFSFDGHDTFLFGRSADCHAQLPSSDPYVSRHHFVMEVNPPCARIRDLGSLNGTFVNDVKIGRRSGSQTPDNVSSDASSQIDLRDGDEIRVGETRLKIALHPLAASSPIERGSSLAVDMSLDERRVCRICGKEMDELAGSGLCQDCQHGNPSEFLGLKNLVAKAADEFESGVDLDELGRLTKCNIEKTIGKGGMGQVYLARRVTDNREVAIKIMRSAIALDDHARQVFMREIDVVSMLRHPNIVEVLGRGMIENVFYFAMDYCNQGSLEQHFAKRNGTVPLAEAMKIIVDAANGLGYGHAKGYVHRDMKPGNILLHQSNGRLEAMVADFGLAKSYIESGMSGLTATREFGGTFEFMAREQITNFRNVKPESDVWSLAATTYWLLTGHVPRECAPFSDPIIAVLENPVIPIRKHGRDIPSALARIIDQGLNADPSRRYRDARDFSRALQSVV